ncbi:hypothetical protein N431DRAFT_510311 [Stipitochalara longipes BDJ]|nr:hypothetical protein N431DRAFT_510311 [Stipitochalara longipes BDJ]
MAGVASQSTPLALASDKEDISLVIIFENRTENQSAEAGSLMTQATSHLPQSLAVPNQRVVEILQSGPRRIPFWAGSLVTRRYSIALLSVCQESRAVALATHNIGFLPPFNNTHYLTPKKITLLFCDLDALTTFSTWISPLVLAIDPKHHLIQWNQNEGESARGSGHAMPFLLTAIRRTRNLIEVILFCEKEDMAFVPSVKKSLKEEWNKENERLKRHFHSHSFLGTRTFWNEVGWTLPKVTPLAYKPNYSLPRTDAQIDDDLSLMRDMLSGFKAF